MSYCSKQIVLICENCGERLVLAGPKEVWRSESTLFECECGEQLTLTSHVEAGGPGIVAKTTKPTFSVRR